MSQLPTYPTSPLDDPDALINMLGPWETVYGGADQVQALCSAFQLAQRQTFTDFDELLACVSRLKLPLLHAEQWYPLTLSQSALNADEQNEAHWGDAGLPFGEPSLEFGVPDQVLYAWTLPDKLVSAPLIFNRITNPSRSWVNGIDYRIQNGSIYFLVNPFADPFVPVTPQLSEGQVIDQSVTLWVCNAGFDRGYLQEQFASVLGLDMPSTPGGLLLTNAIFDAMRAGTTQQLLMQGFSAITDVPLAAGDETVEQIYDDGDFQWVVTDKNSYRFTPAANVLVEAGDTVTAGEPLTDAMLVFEFNRGQVPPSRLVPSLTINYELMIPGFSGPITFPNINVPVSVTTDEDSKTLVSWQLGGTADDIQWFFTIMQARGLASGKTLANLLAPTVIGRQPNAGDLPTIINPLQFFCENILRNGGLLVRINAAATGPDALGLRYLPVLRKIALPQMILFVQIERAGTITTVTLDDLN